jgi:hypothetical protein
MNQLKKKGIKLAMNNTLHSKMDARIGIKQKATGILYYAFANGYNQQEFESAKLADVELAIGLEPSELPNIVHADLASCLPNTQTTKCIYFKQTMRDGEVLTGYVDAKNLTEARQQIAKIYQSDVPRHMRMAYHIEWA